MTPFFSIVIPLYNKETYIAETINCILNQSFKDFEIVIINDGSTDESLNKIASYFNDNRFSILSQENKGASHARNLGVAKSKGKYIALLDADDLWYENHLYELKKQIDLFPNAGLYCNNYEIFYNKKTYRKASFNFEYKHQCLIVKDYFKASIANPIAWTSAVAFSKKDFYDIGKFNTSLKTAQDLDLWIRFALQFKVSFNPTITMSYNLYIVNSLSKKELNDIRYNFINNYSHEEKLNPSLKLYLDINRYAVAIRCKMNNEITLYKKLKKDINYSNLNYKQKITLNTPKFILKLFKNFQHFLIKNDIYFSAYN